MKVIPVISVLVLLVFSNFVSYTAGQGSIIDQMYEDSIAAVQTAKYDSLNALRPLIQAKSKSDTLDALQPIKSVDSNYQYITIKIAK